MFWLIFGLVIWADIHLFKRVMPRGRQALDDAMGAGPAKGVIALILVVSVIMMIVGFRQMAGGEALYYPPTWLRNIGPLFSFLGIIFVGAANSKSRLRGLLRHPMLTGIVLWGIGHLMISGEWRAIILFGGMIIWAIAEIRLINQQEPEFTPYKDGTLKGDLILLGAGVVLTAVIIAIHVWIIRGF